MPVTLEQFAQALTSGGVMSADELDAFTDQLAPKPTDAQGLARELVRAKKLTRFQATQVYQGNAKALVLGDYVLLDKIGEGGMGQVYKALDRQMDRLVALKQLPLKAVESEEAVQRFQREVRAAARLMHPNVVVAFAAGKANGNHFLVQEYVDGQDLAAIIKKDGPLSVKRAVDCIAQAAKGLEYAHGKGIVHRDIKPANLLLDRKGTVKVLDMGLARLDEGTIGNAQAQNRDLTQSGQIMGTVDYMAPEQAEDTRKADGRADIYSLGCTLYRLVTGQAIYPGDTAMQRLLAHREAPIPSLRAGRVDVPESLDAVFQIMVAKTPQQRQQSMAEVTQQLQDVFAAASAQSRSGHIGDNDQPLETSPGSSVPTPASATPRKPHAEETSTWLLKDETGPSLPAPGAARLNKQRQAADRPTNGRSRLATSLAVLGGAAGLAILTILLTIFLPRQSRFEPPTDAVGNTLRREPAKDIQTSEGGTSEPSRSTNHWLAFDGRTSYVELPKLTYDGTHPLTVEARIWNEVHGGYRRVIASSKEGGVSIGPLLAWNDKASVHFSFSDAGNIGAANSLSKIIEPTTWAHLAGVFDGNSLRIFVDGKLVASNIHTMKPFSESHSLLVGATGGQHPHPSFFGLLDEIRISDIPRYRTNFVPLKRFEPDEHTLGLYHCDEGQGDTLFDASAGKRHGHMVGVGWLNESGQHAAAPSLQPPPSLAAELPSSGQILQFDGDNDYVLISSLRYDWSHPLTIEAFVTPTTMNGGFLMSFSSPASGLSLGCSNQRWNFRGTPTRSSQGYCAPFSRHLVKFGRRVHVAGVHNEGSLALFVDGIKVGEDNCENLSRTYVPFVIGAQNSKSGSSVMGSYFRGAIDEVRVSKYVRYTTTFPLVESLEADHHTLALYKFDEGQGSVLIDSSGNGHDGRIVGASWISREELKKTK